MGKRRRGIQDKYIFFIVLICMLALMVTIVRQYRTNNTLEVYNESNVVDMETEDSSTEETTLDVETEIYTYDIGFSIEIPSDWEKVTKSGYDTYVHSASGSSIQIQVLDYDPSINNVSAETESIEVAGNGYTFISYTRNTSSSYELMYQDYQNSTYDYIEEVYWDRQNIVKLVCTFNDENYEKIIPYYEYIINSFGWNRSDPIPEDYVLWYVEAGNFEFAYPITWTTGESSNAIVATDSTTGAAMTVSLTEYTSSLSGLTGTDMASLVGNSKSNYMLNSYTAEDTCAYASSTYISNSVQYTNDTYLFCNGTYLYMISFDYEAGTIDGTLPGDCAGLFREFLSSEETDEGPGDGSGEDRSAIEDTAADTEASDGTTAGNTESAEAVENIGSSAGTDQD